MQLCDLLGDMGALLHEHVHILVPALSHIIGSTDEASLSLLQRTAVEQKTASQLAPIITQPLSSASIAIPESAAKVAAASSYSPESIELMSAASPPEASVAMLHEGVPVDLIDPLMNNHRITGPPIPLVKGTASGPGIGKRATATSNIIGSIYLRRSALLCLIRLTECLSLESMATVIVHSICRILMLLQEKHANQQSLSQGASSYLPGGNKPVKGKPPNPQLALQSLFVPCMEVITNLLRRMGFNFKLVLPLVQEDTGRVIH